MFKSTKARAALATVALAVAGFAAPAAQAATVDGGWESFIFYDVGSSNTFTFSLGSAATLDVTDAYLSGDRFDIILDGQDLGQTSAPLTTGDQVGGDFDAAFADPRWSSGSWVVGAGSHTLEIVVTASPYSSGGAAWQLTSSVPEPSSLGLMGLGLLALGLKARRRSQA